MNQNQKRVVVAMSGGVDSSVAAALLKRQGYDAIGITMHLWDFDRVGGNVDFQNTCCSVEAMNDARMVCHRLGIPHYVLDFREEFEEAVLGNFVEEYLKGRTPNPCIICNTKIKWRVLLRKALVLGASFIATGHYARIDKGRDTERYVLQKGIDRSKDQSYVLWGLDQEKLSRTLFPVGAMHKQGTREVARELGLRTAQKGESQEICFIPDNDYGRFLRERTSALGLSPSILKRGPIMDREGHVLGYHRGAAFYTVGQRRGLGVALGRPVYVARIDAEENILWVGEKEELYSRDLIVSQVNWVSIEGLGGKRRASVKIRYLHEAAPAMISPLPGGRVAVRFDQPQMAITPGQSAVFYDGDVVLGGGIIES